MRFKLKYLCVALLFLQRTVAHYCFLNTYLNDSSINAINNAVPLPSPCTPTPPLAYKFEFLTQAATKKEENERTTSSDGRTKQNKTKRKRSAARRHTASDCYETVPTQRLCWILPSTCSPRVPHTHRLACESALAGIRSLSR